MNEREIFEKAIEIQDPAQRQDFLNQACGRDAKLRGQLDDLLASHDVASQFLNVPVVEQFSPPPKNRVQPTIELSSSSESPQPGDDDDESNPPPDLSFLQPSTARGSIGRLGHYEILQVLGQGAFGIVFKAFDEKLHRHVAIKAMNPQLAVTSPPRKRFLREARSVAAIKHENIVQVYSVEEHPLPYLVMEYIDGQSLQQKLDGAGPLEVGEILHLGRQMAAGLAAAHEKGLIHRDIKPGNILLEAGAEQKVKITDFGLARAADDATVTRTGMIAGTPMYMAPEQALGQTLDHRADLFSLGSVLYQMACGRPPFRGPNAVAVLKRVVDETPRPIQDILPEVPDWLCTIIKKLHAKNRDERYTSAQEVANLINNCLTELHQGRTPNVSTAEREPVSLPKSGPTATVGRSRSRQLLATAAAVALILLIGLGFTEATGMTKLAATVIRITTGSGTLVVEADDPGVSISIDGEELVIKGSGVKEVRLKPGEYKLQASKDGRVLTQELVTITRGGRQVVRVSKEQGNQQVTTDVDAERKAAEWVLAHGGSVQITPGGNVYSLDKLPTHNFTIGLISFGGLKFADETELKCFAGLPHLRQVFLGQAPITGRGLRYFASCPEIVILALDSTAVSDGDLGILKDLKKLEVLTLHNTRTTDAAIDHLLKCRLKQIDLSLTGITDAGLERLGQMKGLQSIQVSQTRVSALGVKSFAANLPRCKIRWDGGVIELGHYKNSLGMEFALIPRGKAWLGGGGGKPGEREVEFKEDFYLGVYEVTQEEWEKVTGSAQPSEFSRRGKSKDAVKDIPDEELKRFPVENINWDEAQMFVNKLNKLEKQPGWIYRLPTSDEWEYACRGGPMDRLDSSFDYYFEKPTTQVRRDQANFRWSDTLHRTCKVGTYHPNSLGLYDLHGNVFEWCIRSAEGEAEGGQNRLTRGGGHGGSMKAGEVGAWPKSFRAWDGGLRVARVRAYLPLPAFAAAPFDEIQAKQHQTEWAKYLGRNVVEENSLGMKLMLIPPGTFVMGNPDTAEQVGVDFAGNNDERPAHEVRITRPFVMSTTEVSQEVFEKILGRNVSGHNEKGHRSDAVKEVDTKSLPVEMVSWFDALEFCNKLSEKENLPPFYEMKFPVRHKDGGISVADVQVLGGRGYRLPTEAEWEFACRAGTTTQYYFPFDYGTNGQYGWFGYIERTHAVGERKPNAFGLCDMLGNVHEWCYDWLGPYSSDGVQDPTGPVTGTERVARGGAYNYLVKYARSAWRGRLRPGARYDNAGIRVARFVSDIDFESTTDPDRRAAVRVLSLGGAVHINDDANHVLQAADLPTNPFRLTGFQVRKPEVEDADLHIFKDCQHISRIDLSFTGIGDAGLEFLAGRKLKSLGLLGTNVTDAGLARLSPNNELTALSIRTSFKTRFASSGVLESR